jgi:hypothetical protein
VSVATVSILFTTLSLTPELDHDIPLTCPIRVFLMECIGPNADALVCIRNRLNFGTKQGSKTTELLWDYNKFTVT